jgi:hypothetical protein
METMSAGRATLFRLATLLALGPRPVGSRRTAVVAATASWPEFPGG